MIVFGRYVSVIFLLLSLILVFFVTSLTFESITAYIATFLVAVNVLTVSTGVVATTDSFLAFFSFLSVFLTLLINHNISSGKFLKITFLSFLLGLSCSLGLGVKISGVLILAFVFCYYLLLIFMNIQKKKLLNKIILSLFIVIVSFFAINVYLHPFLHHDTIQRFFVVLTSRLDGAKYDQLQYPGTAITSRIRRLE